MPAPTPPEHHAVLTDLTLRLMTRARLDAPPPVDRSLGCALDSLGLLLFLADVRRSYRVELASWLAEAPARGVDTLEGLAVYLVARAGAGSPVEQRYG